MAYADGNGESYFRGKMEKKKTKKKGKRQKGQTATVASWKK